MEIKEISNDKKRYLSLLLLADEQEDMVDRYLDRGTMYVLDDNGIKGECVVTDEGNGVLEMKNLAVDPKWQGWGYGNKVSDKDAFIRRFDNITTAVKSLPYVCGYCYTQVSDVQQEINGLMDARRNFKVDPETIREINERKVGYWRSFM